MIRLSALEHERVYCRRVDWELPMARAAIFVTLISATVIAPLLCCCTFAQILNAPQKTAVAAQTTSPAQPTCPHCLPTKPQPNPSEPTQPSPRCPCCEGRATLVLVNQSLEAPPVIAMPLVGLLTIASDPAVATIAQDTPWEYPPGTGQRAFLIDFCHNLRC